MSDSLFANLAMKRKLMISNGTTFLFMLLIAGSGEYALRQANISAKRIYRDNVVPIASLGEASSARLRTQYRMLQHVISGSEKDMADAETRCKVFDEEFNKAMNTYEQGISSDLEREVFPKYKAAYA